MDRKTNLTPAHVALDRLRRIHTLPADQRTEASWAWVTLLLPRIRVEARRRVGSTAFEDIAHEVAIRLVDRIERGRLRPGHIVNARGWLGTVIRRIVSDVALPHWRHQKREERLPEHIDLVQPDHAVPSSTPHWRSWGMGAVQGFVLIAVTAPDLFDEYDVIAACRASTRPGAGLSRCAEETHRLLVEWRSSNPRQEEELPFILRGPPGVFDLETWPDPEAQRARNWMYTQVFRARTAARQTLAPPQNPPAPNRLDARPPRRGPRSPTRRVRTATASSP